MKRDENEGRGSRDDVRRLDGGNATSLTWLKNREERDVVADARDDDECRWRSSQARREEKRCVALDDESSESLDVGGQGRNDENKVGADAKQ